MNEPEKVLPLIGQRCQILDIPAALTGHLTSHAHIFTTVVVDGAEGGFRFNGTEQAMQAE